MTNCFNFSTILWILLSFSSFIEQYIFHPFRLSGPSRDESYFSAHSAKNSPLLNPWPSGFLPLPFRRRKRGTGLVNPAPAFVRFILAAKPSALSRRSLSAFAGLRAPRPRPQTRNRMQPLQRGKACEYGVFTPAAASFPRWAGVLYSLPPKRISAVHWAHFQPFSLPASP